MVKGTGLRAFPNYPTLNGEEGIFLFGTSNANTAVGIYITIEILINFVHTTTFLQTVKEWAILALIDAC